MPEVREVDYVKYLALLIPFLLCGCETVETPDGTRTTRWDAAATAAAVDSGFRAYDQYNRAKYIVGYYPDGTPIYAR